MICTSCGHDLPLDTEHFRMRLSGPRVGQFMRACRACERSAVLSWMKRNPEKRRAYKASRRGLPIEREGNRRRTIRWNRKHPDVKAQRRREREAIVRGAIGSGGLTARGWSEIVAYFGGACAYCLRTGVPLEQDHVVPVSRGGSHSEPNVVPACRSCNARKYTKGILTMLHAA